MNPQIRRTASEIRAKDLLADRGCANQIPVPVERIAASLGAAVRYQPFEADDISGLLLRQDGQRPIIGVNSVNASVRQRFTIAHEIGHLLLHEGKGLILDRLVRVNFRDAVSSTATDRQEREANAFAAALLMPDEQIIQQLQHLTSGTHKSDTKIVQSLAKAFDVSRQAMEFRLINLGLLTPA